jgi:hypothetical protein
MYVAEMMTSIDSWNANFVSMPIAIHTVIRDLIVTDLQMNSGSVIVVNP